MDPSHPICSSLAVEQALRRDRVDLEWTCPITGIPTGTRPLPVCDALAQIASYRVHVDVVDLDQQRVSFGDVVVEAAP